MPDYKSPISYDSANCSYSALGANDKLPPENIPVAGILSDAACNLLSTDNSGLLKLCASDLVSTIDGGNVIGVNPDDNKLYINPCLIPGPQNIVSNKLDNIIQKDPDDCSAYLNAIQVTEEVFSTGDERGYYGPGLVYVENQDGSHQLRAAICNGLTTNVVTLTDGAGNEHTVRAIEVNLDPDQPILHFVPNSDQCQDCLSACDMLSITFSLNASGSKLRILDKDNAVYSQISLSNGLQGDGSGGLTINTLDTYTDGTSDLPVSEKALKSLRDGLAKVARTGEYNDLLNKPNLHAVATSGNYNDLINRPNLHAVATSGDYNDLINKPNIPANFTVDDTVSDGNMNAVTSNAVYDAIQAALAGGVTIGSLLDFDASWVDDLRENQASPASSVDGSTQPSDVPIRGTMLTPQSVGGTTLSSNLSFMAKSTGTWIYLVHHTGDNGNHGHSEIEPYISVNGRFLGYGTSAANARYMTVDTYVTSSGEVAGYYPAGAFVIALRVA